MLDRGVNPNRWRLYRLRTLCNLKRNNRLLSLNSLTRFKSAVEFSFRPARLQKRAAGFRDPKRGAHHHAIGGAHPLPGQPCGQFSNHLPMLVMEPELARFGCTAFSSAICSLRFRRRLTGWSSLRHCWSIGLALNGRDFIWHLPLNGGKQACYLVFRFAHVTTDTVETVDTVETPSPDSE
jgi:hypothetical protein